MDERHSVHVVTLPVVIVSTAILKNNVYVGVFVLPISGEILGIFVL